VNFKIIRIIPLLLFTVIILMIMYFSNRLPQDLSIKAYTFEIKAYGNFLVAIVEDYDILPDIIPEKYHIINIKKIGISYLCMHERKEILNEIQLLLKNTEKDGNRIGSDWSSVSAVHLRVDSGNPFLATTESHTLLNKQILSFVCKIGKYSNTVKGSDMFNRFLKYIQYNEHKAPFLSS